MTPQRFRFIDCAAFIREDKLRILASDSEAIIDSVKYAAVSYPWKGNCPENTDDFISTSFAVEGAELGDRIALDVLQTICAASVQLLIRYLWLDRLCVMQTCREDKDWQIQRMALIYERCSGCLIIPGGLGRVVGFRDKTLWIYRAWTLQEALLPPEAWCLFRWERDEGVFRLREPDLQLHLFKVRHSDMDEDLREWKGTVRDSLVGMLHLSDVLLLCTRQSSFEFTPFTTRLGLRGETMDSFILFSEETTPILALVAAAKARESKRERAAFKTALGKAEEKVLEMANAGYLPNGANSELEEGKKTLAGMEADAFGVEATEQMAIWRCAIMRTSRKEVDIVYSIMSLFGVNLDRSAYKTRQDALIALCQAILRKGGSPQWLGASLVSPISSTFCTMPTFPGSASKDVPLIQIPGCHPKLASEMVGPFPTYLDCTPSGTLDKDGFTEFTAPMSAVRIDILSGIQEMHPHLDGTPFIQNSGITTARITANNSQVETGFAGEIGTHAVVIGRMRTYAYLDDGSGRSHGHWLMLIKRLEDDDGNTTVERWHKTGILVVDTSVEGYFLRGWERKKIRVGGI
jgi:Heterokaryon incompatibility protein (HET)